MHHLKYWMETHSVQKLMSGNYVALFNKNIFLLYSKIVILTFIERSLGIVFYQICTNGKLPFKTIKSICFENLTTINTLHTEFESIVLRYFNLNI